MNNFDLFIQSLQEAREEARLAREAANAMIVAVKESPAYQEALQKAEEATKTADHIETDLRDMALDAYAENGNKKPHEKVQVKIFREFSVTDPHAMRTWVDSNLRDALIVDEKKVKEYALKIGAVDGTQVIETAKAQIASDLS